MIKTDKKPEQYAPLVLAYIGDAIYEAYVRSRVIEENPDMPAYKLHNKSVKYVKAHAQANSIHAMTEMLTEEEMAIFKRGRNAKSPTTAKNATLVDYRHATGFEALIGYTYISGNTERLHTLMKSAYENALEKPNN
ncbi:MAG: ribonuclease III domain-containing protein [Clostridia bacterium]|nr:ribonuclease III domain-containing protein [Clostridia bacterium]